MKLLVILPILAVFGLSVSNASSRVRDHDFLRDFSRSTKKARAVASLNEEKVTKKGVLKCDSEYHSKADNCDLVLETENGETYNIVESKLTKKHCEEHYDLLVEITGKLDESFLFGNDDILVNEYKIIKKLALNLPKKRRHKVRQFERFGRFER